jgi:hypothetical protein
MPNFNKAQLKQHSMQLSNEEEDYNLSLSKFESMLKTNKSTLLTPKNLKKLFFIIWVRLVWQKSLKLALEQHTQSHQD